MKIEIITIGDELLIGQIVNTNSAWMAAELTTQGFGVDAMTTVGDAPGDLLAALDTAFARADILLLTGGVGPTRDDRTKETLCRYFDCPLILNEEVLQHIEQLFQSRKATLNSLTRDQALVPSKATVIPNRVGTAPLLWFRKGAQLLVSMPGVPLEMQTAMREEIMPRLSATFRQKAYLRRDYLVGGYSESALATHLSSFEDQLPASFSLAYLPTYGIIRLRLSAWGEEHTATMEQQGKHLRELLGSHCLSESNQMVEQLLGELLQEKRFTLSTAESCTGGYIAHLITSVAGASGHFTGSVVAYDNHIKEILLQVETETLSQKGAVSREVAEQMARGVAAVTGTTCAIAVTGIMGPDGGSEEKPVGTVWVATLCGERLSSREYRVGKSRAQNIERTARLAILQMLMMLQ
ncbi:MAG: CinA family nicotinamide mononucleotide deamidase-related protein [Proteiniphilum sp.]|jgi:nicotinamide-nucleotide amidase|nr:CinA family nicotinamide mononucleotide deamidase-related protein [Proteiniphilum sp.]HHT34372.1 CinA family nicotinamide mononucleotide deamidase-related protein [Bacteroidales bacterium]MDD3332909.1 CinA family nicotinamide mononucleotide deamidase-related protein [Proteiniphilum sp.]MDD3979024.1 CinA family nicotinamide mononucleotide deamidase-related protein [Proteiniphilum sp.]MDD4485458.1 CinA family nicotinamide mononucleotide deamidase-related protein [Proteiniphilum sp.]